MYLKKQFRSSQLLRASIYEETINTKIRHSRNRTTFISETFLATDNNNDANQNNNIRNCLYFSYLYYRFLTLIHYINQLRISYLSLSLSNLEIARLVSIFIRYSRIRIFIYNFSTERPFSVLPIFFFFFIYNCATSFLVRRIAHISIRHARARILKRRP